MPSFDISAGLVYSYTVVAASAEEAMESEEDAKRAFASYYGLSPESYDSDGLVVWDEPLLLDFTNGLGPGESAYVLTACLTFDFQVDAADEEAAEEAAWPVLEGMAAEAIGSRSFGDGALGVWGATEQLPAVAGGGSSSE